MSFIESLESRTLLAGFLLPDDPGNTRQAALNLGALSGTKLVKQSLSPSDTDDFYRFVLKNRTNFNLSLTNLSANADVQILSSDGTVFDNATAEGASPEEISRSLNKGTYYVRVFSEGDADTNYALTLQADLNWGVIKSGSQRKEVGLEFANGDTGPINRNRETWIIIHGWNSSPDGQAISHLADAIDGFSTRDQVLMLDWSDPADDDSIILAARWSPKVADFVAAALRRWGIPSGKINLAGHSLGGLVAHDLAEEIDGGVDRILALDPATDLPKLFVSGVDYARNSKFSAGFIGSEFATPRAAFTADEAFRLRVGDEDSIVTHSNVVDLVASMIDISNDPKPDPISSFFALNQLSPRANRPFRPNAISGNYEGNIRGRQEDGQWLPDVLTYKNRSNGRIVTVRA